MNPQMNLMYQLKKEVNNDICKLIEKVFRVRDNEGNLFDYKVVEPHRRLLRTGLLGDRSILTRIKPTFTRRQFQEFLLEGILFEV